MNKITMTIAGASLMASMSVSASVITYETRDTTTTVNQNDYQASWNAQTSTIDSQNITDFTNITAPGRDKHSKLTATFDVGSAFASSDWIFQIAPDAGHGGAMYIDGVQLDVDKTDLWWNYKWSNTTEILSSGTNVSEGSHTLEAFWAEGCCNGGQSARFSTDNGVTWQALSTANLDDVAVDVPEPASIALFGLGLMGLGLRNRRKAA